MERSLTLLAALALLAFVTLCVPATAEAKYWPDDEGPFLALETRSRAGELATIRVSNYWPPLGGTNCSWFVGGVCRSRTASGERWEDWTERGIACTRAGLLTLEVWARGKWWLCVDTGAAVVIHADGNQWIDFMTQTPLQDYGTTMEVRVREVQDEY